MDCVAIVHMDCANIVTKHCACIIPRDYISLTFKNCAMAILKDRHWLLSLLERGVIKNRSKSKPT